MSTDVALTLACLDAAGQTGAGAAKDGGAVVLTWGQGQSGAAATQLRSGGAFSLRVPLDTAATNPGSLAVRLSSTSGWSAPFTAQRCTP